MIPHLYVGPGAGAAALHEAAACLESPPDGHPDARLEIADSGEVGIDRIRDLILWVRYAPVRASRKVAVVGPAERLTREAGNALLKLLEELPPHLNVVLFAAALDRVLPTVRSRCALLWCSDASSQIESALRAAGYTDGENAFLSSLLGDRVEDVVAFLGDHRKPLQEWNEARAAAEDRSLEELATGFLSHTADPLRRRAWGHALSAALLRGPTDEILGAAERLGKAGKDAVAAFLSELARFLVEEAPTAWPDVDPATRLAWARSASLSRGELDENANPRLLLEVVALWPRRG